MVKGGKSKKLRGMFVEADLTPQQALPGRAPNPTPDATERAPEGQVVVASQQVPEDQLIVAAQQHVYQPTMPYTHMVPQ